MSREKATEEKPIRADISTISNKASDTQESQNDIISNVQDIHRHFGNAAMNHAHQNPTGALDAFIGASLTLEASGVEVGAMQDWMGNQGMSGMISRKRISGGSDNEILPSAHDPAVQRIGQGQGEKIDSSLLQTLEKEFQHSFGHVRIHKSGADADSAKALNAHAFTVGADIYFDRGQFSPQTKQGLELLAHELTHVVQFDEGRLPSHGGEMSVSSPSDAVEVEAVAKGAEVARSIGSFSPSVMPSDMVHDVAGGIGPSVGAHIDSSFGTQKHDIQQSNDTAQVLHREQNQSGVDVDVSTSTSVSLSLEITIPLYPPVVNIKAKVNGSYKAGASNDEDSQSEAITSEVEASLYAGIQFNLYFLTIDLGIQGNIKFMMNGEQDVSTLVTSGVKEVVNWKLAKDFLPNLKKAKKGIGEAFDVRTEKADQQFAAMRTDIIEGDWKSATDYYLLWDSPRENVEDEIKYLASSINSATSHLDGVTQVTKENIIDWGPTNRALSRVHNAPDQDTALQYYTEARNELVYQALPKAKRGLLADIDRCAPHPNNPNIGFEGGVQFVAGASAQLTESASVSGQVSQTTKIQDEVGATDWNFNASTETEASVAVSIGDYGFSVAGKFDPDFSSRTKMEIKVSGEMNSSIVESKPPETTAQTTLEALRNGVTSIRNSGSAINTIRNIASSSLQRVRNANSNYFSASARAERSELSGNGTSKAILEFTLKFERSGRSMAFKGVSVTIKQESGLSLSGAGFSGAMPVTGSVSSGSAVTVSFNV